MEKETDGHLSPQDTQPIVPQTIFSLFSYYKRPHRML